MDAVEIVRHVPASVDQVFEWWTHPERLREWMSPVGTVEAEVDLRVGGTIRIVMSGDGMTIEHLGTYIDIQPPRRLEFSWTSRFTGGRPTLVVVELEPEGKDSTRLRLTHRQLPQPAVESHRGGWAAMLDRLEDELQAAAEITRGG